MNKADTLRVSENAVAAIAEQAVREVGGIEEIVRDDENFGVLSDIKRKLKHSKFFSKTDIGARIFNRANPAVKVHLLDGVLEIYVAVVLKSTAGAASAAEKIQRAVKFSVQNMTGIPVAKVNVRIAGIAVGKS